MAGLNDDKLIEAHGTYNTGHCQACGAEYTKQWMKGEALRSFEKHFIIA